MMYDIWNSVEKRFVFGISEPTSNAAWKSFKMKVPQAIWRNFTSPEEDGNSRKRADLRKEGGEILKCSRKRIMQGAILTNLATAQKNMASAEKVDARGLILLSKFLLRLLDKLDDEMVQLVTQDQQQRN